MVDRWTSAPHVVSPPATEKEIAASDNRVIREGLKKVQAMHVDCDNRGGACMACRHFSTGR